MSLGEDPSGQLHRQIAVAERLLDERQIREAISAFDVAEQMGADPDRCSAGRWMGAMLLGDFAAAWRESDRIRLRGGADPHRFWRGEEICGRRVIVRCLHGFGDAIQFLRYVPKLRSLADRLIVEVPPRLVELAPMLQGVDEVVTWGEGAPEQPSEFDVQVEVMELPYLFRTTQMELPIAEEYLQLSAHDTNRAAQTMGRRGLPRVGLVWAAGQWNMDRSISITDMEPIVRSGLAEFWTLQGGAAAAQARPWIENGTVCDAAECGEGMLALAAVIANLDLVITVDTLAAHVAGALGVPVWVMLQHAADWRWMSERCDSPWYPKMRLFRQPAQGDWGSVVEKIRAELVKRNFHVSAGEIAG